MFLHNSKKIDCQPEHEVYPCPVQYILFAVNLKLNYQSYRIFLRFFLLLLWFTKVKNARICFFQNLRCLLGEIFVLFLRKCNQFQVKIFAWSFAVMLNGKWDPLAALMCDAHELKRALAECALWWLHMTRLGPNLFKICSNF